ncbi:protein kinase domain-containing protein [Legionella spiritensis]|uniref:Protein kinase domain-containing protein n=1 Tax=Legionella spiritensis TaxID=452 RepID=A0A0W0YXQ4_LEGSP|nr:protein kinase [Legionella spiritensis]KTD61406.1 putative protein kinase [Legionella spiritensis]SNV33472.1 Serine/threonine protein kinase [Legionella spiritensis]
MKSKKETGAGNPITINPASMDDRQRAILREYVENKSLRFISAGNHSYTVASPDGHSTTTKIRLTAPLLKNDLKPDNRSLEVVETNKQRNGGFGTVQSSKGVIKMDKKMIYKVREGEKERVVKRIPLDGKSTKKRIKKEAERTRQGSSVLHCKAALFGKTRGYIIMRRAPGMELHELMKKIKKGERTLNTLQRLQITRAIIAAVKDIHDKSILHLDIKPRNIMVDPDTLNVTIIDFGLATDITKTSLNTTRGSYNYIAPELMEKGDISPTSDVFSLGQTLAEFWNNRLPLPGASNHAFYRWALCNHYFNNDDPVMQFTEIEAPEVILEDVSELLWNLTRFNPEDRLSLDEAIKKTDALVALEHFASSDVDKSPCSRLV